MADVERNNFKCVHTRKNSKQRMRKNNHSLKSISMQESRISAFEIRF